MTFKGAIFDLDGTLLDSMQVWTQIDIDFLKQKNIPYTDEYTRAVATLGFDEAATYTIQQFNLPETPQQIIAEWNNMGAEYYHKHVQMKAGAKEYLSMLRHKGIKLATATSLLPSLAQKAFTGHGLQTMFHAETFTHETGKSVKDADVYLLAAKRIGLKPEECIVFEDILPGIKGAKEAGMLTCGVFDQSSSHSWQQIQSLADIAIYSFQDAPIPS